MQLSECTSDMAVLGDSNRTWPPGWCSRDNGPKLWGRWELFLLISLQCSLLSNRYIKSLVLLVASSFFLLTLFSDPYSKDDKCLWDPKRVSVTECKYDMFCIYVHSCIRFYELCCFCLCTIINFSYVFLFSIKLWMIYIALHVYNVVGKVCKSCFFFRCINQPFE